MNPEVIESAYYLWHYTGDSLYFNRVKQYYDDLKAFCRTDIAYTHLADVTTKEKKNELATFFFAETMKYIYLTFSDSKYNPDIHVFSTEAHIFRKDQFKNRDSGKPWY